MPRSSGAVRPRLVLGVTLLLVGLGDVLFLNIVLLPQVLAVESGPPARPTASTVPVAAPPVLAGIGSDRGAGGDLAVAPVPTPSPPPPPAEQPAPEPAPPAEEPAPTVARATPSFSPLLFIQSTAWLSPEAEDVLAKVAAVMKEDTTLRVRLDGHTDELGAERFNRVLSLKRARRARERLQDLGIAQARIDIKGYGSEQPADTERTAKARARNRRVEITLF